MKTDLVQTHANIYRFNQMKHNVTQWAANCVLNRLLGKISSVNVSMVVFWQVRFWFPIMLYFLEQSDIRIKNNNPNCPSKCITSPLDAGLTLVGERFFYESVVFCCFFANFVHFRSNRRNARQIGCCIFAVVYRLCIW